MKFSFSKMQALGNDFVVINGVNQIITLSAADVRILADRHRGIGFDQLLLVQSPMNTAEDFHYRVFNADGSEVAQCGNGARCLARFIREQGLSNKPEIVVGTAEGLMKLRLLTVDTASVSLGIPRFKPQEIPHQLSGNGPVYALTVLGQTLEFRVVNVGNPHVVIRVPDVNTVDISAIGAAVGRHPAFPEGVNVGFLAIESPLRLQLRVYERGAGETQACGSGACAAAVISHSQGWCGSPVTVSQPGGDLVVSWAGVGQEVWLAGPAEHVYNGEW